MVSLPLKKVIRVSLSEIPYDIWVFPGLMFIIGSFSIYPILYREFFELRINRKVLINISLTPYTKLMIVFSSLIVSIIESFLIVLFSSFIYSVFTPLSIMPASILVLFICLFIYFLLLGNLYITMSLCIDSITTMFIVSFMVFIFILFGNGFLIELSFFPISIESILKWSPFSIPFQVYHQFDSTRFIDLINILLIMLLNYFWLLLNSFILKKKLQQ
tara:strand:+ start:138 stop:788 length:651 start_codon:yes stop_codon:yes gene_type:complete